MSAAAAASPGTSIAAGSGSHAGSAPTLVNAGSTAAGAPATESGAMGAAGSEPVEPGIPCDESQRTPPPMAVDLASTGEPPSGRFKVSVETDATLGPYTIYRPELGDTKLPIIAWGNGGCIKNGIIFGEFLIELASRGFLIIADGAPDGFVGDEDAADGDALVKAIDWAVAENDRPCSPYYRKLESSKIAVMGQSCGGLMSIAASSDPRVTTIVMWNSGLFERDPMVYAKLHAPMAIVNGGDSDIAYANGAADFAAIDTVPILFANMDVGHLGTYFDDNGGEFAKLGVAWLNWHLFEDEGAMGKQMFVGASCGLCSNGAWVIESKMLR